MDKLNALALELLKSKINAYWRYADAQINSFNWNNRPGDQALKEWTAECKVMAKIILESLEKSE